MGKATVQSYEGNGLYSIKLDRNADLINEKISSIDQKLLTATDIKKASLEKRKEVLESLLDPDAINAWCADLSAGLSGEVDTIEINGEPEKVLLAPASPGFQELDAANMTPIDSMSPAQAAFNFMAYPGWQFLIPTYRIGTIVAMDGNNCAVDLDPAVSFYGPVDLDINKYSELTDVPIKYMSCDGAAFDVDDRVIIEFKNQSWDTPQVIGFETEPQTCQESLIVEVVSTDETQAFAWDVLNNVLVVPIGTHAEVKAALVELGLQAVTKAEMSGSVAETMAVPTANTYTEQGQYNQPEYLEGFYSGMTYALSVGRHIPHTVSYTPSGHIWHWDFYYMEAPDFSKNGMDGVDNHRRGAVAIHVLLLPAYGDAAKKAEYEALGRVWSINQWIKPFGHISFGPDHVFYYYQPVFNTPAVYTIKELLDQTDAIEMMDSWYDVDQGDAYFMENNGGLAENDAGAVVFEIAASCADVNQIDYECQDETKYKKEFRIFAHQKDGVSDFVAEVIELINDERTEPDLVENFAIRAAATRHAVDCADHGFTGEIGTDGSTPEERLTDANYDLNADTAAGSVKSDISITSGVDLNAAEVVAYFLSDPEINLLSADYKEISVAVETADDGTDYVVLCVGGVVNRWPGFAPVDTTDLDQYLRDNFSFVGDITRLTEMYLAGE